MIDYKNKVLNLVVSNWSGFNWTRDKSSGYPDYEAKTNNGVTLRVVSNAEGTYLQILLGPANYQCFDTKDYPEVNELFNNIHDEWVNAKANEFFNSVYIKLSNSLGLTNK